MAKNLIERCPFREGSASHKIYAVLAKAPKPMRVEHVAKVAKVPVEKTATLLAAYKNPFHNAPMRRAGVCIESDKGLYLMKAAKVEPRAKRPERGKAKKRKPAKKQPGTKAIRKKEEPPTITAPDSATPPPSNA